jgi:predicted amidohydrolase YtcJ
MRTILLIFLLSITISSCHFGNDKVDMIIHNATIYLMDETGTTVDAMAIKDGIIVAYGPEREIMNQYDAPLIYDAAKRPVYPGFIDGHCHFLAYGLMLQDADLTAARNWKDVISILQAYAPNRTSEWIIGRGWDQNDWAQKQEGLTLNVEEMPSLPFPDKKDLDALFPDIPVYLTRIDGHAVLVNQAALDAAGINTSTAIVGGVVEVKEGKCTGILIDNAIGLVDKVMPKHTRLQKEKALMLAQEKCFQVGLTTIDDAGLMHEDIMLIDSLQKAGILKMRVYAMLSDDESNYNIYLSRKPDTTNRMLNVRSFKLYADGALGSRGACMLSPYEDILKELGRKEHGFLLNTPDYYLQRARQLYAAGYQMNTHAIGDSANRVMLHVYKEVLGGTNDKRWRIEHAQVVDKNDIGLFSLYSVIPSVQPTHATSDMPWAWMRLGRARVARAYAYKELLDENGMLALGTDFPVEGISPIATYYAAVSRRDRSGQPSGGFQKENALSREEAMMGMTIWNAIANFESHYKGSIAVGKVADIVVLERDIVKCLEDKILDTQVELTVVGGKMVYRKEKKM